MLIQHQLSRYASPPTIPALAKTFTTVQAKALYERLGQRRPSFLSGFKASGDCEPLTHVIIRRYHGSRSFCADFCALCADRDQALDQLLNA